MADTLLLPLYLRGGVETDVGDLSSARLLLVIEGPSANADPPADGDIRGENTIFMSPSASALCVICNPAALSFDGVLVVAARRSGCTSGTGLKCAGGSGGESGV